MNLLEDAVDPKIGLTIAEHRGTGIPAMFEAKRAADRSPARFDDTIADFRVTFPKQSLIGPDTLLWLRTLGATADGLTRHQPMALALLRAGETLTSERYRRVSAVDSRVATRELGDLAARGLIQMSGVGRWAEYTLPVTTSALGDEAATHESVTARRGVWRSPSHGDGTRFASDTAMAEDAIADGWVTGNTSRFVPHLFR